MPVKITPMVCAACGAAVAYYCFFPLYRSGSITANVLITLAFIPVTALSLFQALSSFPLVDGTGSRLFRMMPLRITAFAAGLALGIGAGTKAVQQVTFGIPENTVQGITGVLLDDPRIISGGRAMSILSLRMASGKFGVKASARGEITVFFPEESAGRLKEFGRGTEVYAEGFLRNTAGTFGSTYILSADSLHITKIAPPLERFRTGVRIKLTLRFTQSSLEDASIAGVGGLALALLVGIRDSLDTGLVSLYRDAGCSYILALSGMHLAVLIAVISFLLKNPLGLRCAAVVGAVIILAYCFIIGPMPSLVRSVLMYLLGVFAVLGMLKRDSVSLLCMAFLIQLAATPQAGLSLSFILSYLALIGILIIGGSLNAVFKGSIPPFLLQPLSVSAGAFIATAAATASFFEVLRPVGIIAGLVIAPLTTVFMIGSLVWLCLDTVLPVLSPVLAKPLFLLYWLMEKTAWLSAKMPGIKVEAAPVLAVSLLAVVLILWLYCRQRLSERKLEPFA